jgi:hypothetical protein
LLAVSSLTNLSVIVTAFFYHFRTLKPNLSSLINGGLTALWVMGFGMLTWNLSGTLSHNCDIDNWNHETGIMVCRIYKALEAFTIGGLYVYRLPRSFAPFSLHSQYLRLSTTDFSPPVPSP